jgi:hypothetical protein
MAQLVVRDVPQDTMDEIDALAGPRKREAYVRDLLNREAGAAMALRNVLLPVGAEIAPGREDVVRSLLAIGWLSGSPERRKLPASSWTAAPESLRLLATVPLPDSTFASGVLRLAAKIEALLSAGVAAPTPLYSIDETSGALKPTVPASGAMAALVAMNEPQRQALCRVAVAFANAHLEALAAIDARAGLAGAATAARRFASFAPRLAHADRDPLVTVRTLGIDYSNRARHLALIAADDGRQVSVQINRGDIVVGPGGAARLIVGMGDDNGRTMAVRLPRNSSEGSPTLRVPSNDVTVEVRQDGPRCDTELCLTPQDAARHAEDAAAVASTTLDPLERLVACTLRGLLLALSRSETVSPKELLQAAEAAEALSAVRVCA